MKTETVLVTPKLAAIWLENNGGNRTIRPGILGLYKNILLAGEWQLTHQGVAISDTGKLLDGQHRLKAIMETGISAEMQVSFGLSDDAFKVIDRGSPRTMSDATRLAERVSSTLVFMLRNNNQVYNSAKPTADHVLQLYEGLKDDVDSLFTCCGTSRKLFTSAPFKAAAIVHSASGRRDFAFSTYRTMANADTATTNPLVIQMFKKSMSGTLVTGGASAQLNLYEIAYFVMDESNTKQILRITEDDRKVATEALKKVVSEVIK